MKIGFDSKRAIQNNTGLGNYSRYIVEILSQYYDDNSYLLFAPRKKKNDRLADLQSRNNVQFFYPKGVWTFFRSLWRSWGVKKDLKLEGVSIFHGLSNELPFGIQRMGVKSVVSLHDLIFLRYPQYYKPIDRMIYKFKFGYACRVADCVIAISECTKHDIITTFGIAEEKVRVVYQGCNPCFGIPVSDQKKSTIVDEYALPPQFILYVGSIESRKNLLLIVKALHLIDSSVHLVAIGKKTAYQTEVERYVLDKKLGTRVHIHNHVPFDDLSSFYQLAKLFVYPSFFEGFGIPIVEALMSGIPVIAATGSCLEEAGGGATLYIDPTNEVELSEKINLILSDANLAADMIEKGKEHIKKFSEKNIAQDLMKVYTEVLL